MSDSFDMRIGHCIDVMREMPEQSIQCCVTSPPYWGLRTYGTEPQVWGGRPDCVHEWHDTSYRDSRKTDTTAGAKQRTNAGATGWRDGTRQNETCSLCGAWSGELGLEPTPDLFIDHLVLVFREVRRIMKDDGSLWVVIGDSYAANRGYQDVGNTKASSVPLGLKPKDLIGIPWMLAFALRRDGWWLRMDNIWHKPNSMPESVTDRCTKAHEYVFHLSKSAVYYCDMDAIKEHAVYPGDHGFLPGPIAGCDDDKIAWRAKSQQDRKLAGVDSRTAGNDFRNKRSVWRIATQGTPDAHFATYPVELAETCILAGCPAGGVVFDPFSGAGTTGLAAIKHGRRYIGSELNPEYGRITSNRTARHAPLFA